MITIWPLSALNFVGIFEMSVLKAVCMNRFVLLSVTKKILNVKWPVLVMLIVHRVVKETVEIFKGLVLLITS